MSIADKLTYLNTTKQLLKTEINKINNVLDDNSTFRSYPQELFNGYLDILNNGTDTLWNNLEKVSATGEEATLENVETAPMKIELSGNTSQETTTGKNFLEYTLENLKLLNTNGTWNENVYSLNGISYTINEDLSITTNGTATATTNLVLIDTLALTSGTKYILSGCPSNGAYNTYNLRIYAGTNYSIDIGVGFEFTFETQNLIRVNFSNGATANNLIFKPMVRLANITDDSYEPYTGGQPSPSPDYPQEVKVVKGENVVSVQGKNLFDKDNQAKVQVNAEGTLRYGLIVDASNKKVSISGKNWSGYIAYKPLTNGVYGQWININRDTTINVTDKLIIYSNGDTIKLNTYVDDLQIEISDAPTPYVPYSKTDYPINLGDIELCKINTYKDYFHKDSGKWYVHKEIGKVILSSNAYVSDLAFGTNSYSLSLPYSHFMAVDNAKIMVLSNKYKGISYNDRTQEISNSIYQPNYNNRIDFRNTNFTSVENFKTNNIGTIVYLVLATPTEEEITNSTLIEQLEAISKAKSVKDKTYITQTNDELPFILDVEAIKEYEVN